MVYAVKRLCKGLGSGRMGARQGFALTLAGVLKRAGVALTPADALDALAAALEPGAAAKGGDARDMLLGMLFGYGAVARGCGDVCDTATAARLVAAAAELAARKSFLREAAAAVVLEVADRLDPAAAGAPLAGLAPWLCADPADASPEALLLALRLWSRLPPALRAACPLLPPGGAAAPAALFAAAGPLGAADVKAAAAAAAAFFTDAHLRRVLPALRATSNAHPRLHSVWPALLALLNPGPPGALPAAELRAFWTAAVEGDIFQSASHERKHLGLALLNSLLPDLRPEHVPSVFSPGLLRCLSNSLAKPDAYLHASAKRSVERVARFIEGADAETRVAAEVAIKRHGGALAERLAKARKGAARAAAAAPADGAAPARAPAAPPAARGEGLESYVAQLEARLDRPGAGGGAGDAEEDVARERHWAAEQLAGAAKQVEAGPELKLRVLRFLTARAFFATAPAAAEAETLAGKKRKAAAAPALAAIELPEATRQLCASRLIAAADHLSRPLSQRAPGKAAADAAAAEGVGVDFLTEVAAHAADLRARGAALARPAGADGAAVADALAALRLRLRTLPTGGAEGRGARLRAISHLVALLELHTLGDPAAVDAETAADLSRVCDAAFGGADGGAVASASSDEDDDGAPHWMDSLVDVLLALLARNHAPLPSAPLRDAAERAFRAFCDALTPAGMADLLLVVEQGAGGAGDDGVLVPDGGEGGEESDGGGSGSDSESEEDEHEEDEASESEEEAEAAAAGAKAAKRDGSDSGSDSDASADADDFTDEQMFKMDAKLAAYFSTVRDSRSVAKASAQELANFKMRVLALLEAFMRREPASPLLPAAATPLLAALVAASKPGGGGGAGAGGPLAERLAGLLRNRLAKSRAAFDASADEEDVAGALRRALYLASRSADKRVSSVAAAVYVFLLRAAATGPGGALAPPAAASLAAAADDLFTKKKTRLGRPFFVEVLRRVPPAAPALLPRLLAQAAAPRSEYLGAEARALVEVALRCEGADAAPHGAALTAMLTAAVAGDFAKPQRRAEALKVAVKVAEVLAAGTGGAPAALGAKPCAALRDAARAAAGEHGGKLDGQLNRLVALLEGGKAAAGGGAGKAAAGKGKAGAKPKAKTGGGDAKRSGGGAPAAGAAAKKARVAKQ
jgi:DNA polymerase phi